MTWFQFEGHRVFYTREGAGDPMLFLPIATLTGHLWEHQVEHFKANNDVIVVDVPGFGHSDFTRPTLDLYVRWLERFVHDLESDVEIEWLAGEPATQIVCGPRIDPSTVPAPAGVHVRGYVPRLYEHVAACDAAIVQGGGTTTLELTALRRPFVYFPLERHFEQQRVVAQRLARHRAGARASIHETSPDALAELIAGELGRQADWPAIPTGGARWAARLIGALAGTTQPQTRRPHANARASKRHQPSRVRAALPPQPARRRRPWRDRPPAPRARRPRRTRR